MTHPNSDPHNTEPKPSSGARLRSLVERIERLNEEKSALAHDIKQIYDEAKSAGYDVKVLRRLVADRQREASEIEEQETLLDVYRRALEGV